MCLTAGPAVGGYLHSRGAAGQSWYVLASQHRSDWTFDAVSGDAEHARGIRVGLQSQR